MQRNADPIFRCGWRFNSFAIDTSRCAHSHWTAHSLCKVNFWSQRRQTNAKGLLQGFGRAWTARACAAFHLSMHAKLTASLLGMWQNSLSSLNAISNCWSSVAFHWRRQVTRSRAAPEPLAHAAHAVYHACMSRLHYPHALLSKRSAFGLFVVRLLRMFSCAGLFRQDQGNFWGLLRRLPAANGHSRGAGRLFGVSITLGICASWSVWPAKPVRQRPRKRP